MFPDGPDLLSSGVYLRETIKWTVFVGTVETDAIPRAHGQNVSFFAALEPEDMKEVRRDIRERVRHALRLGKCDTVCLPAL